MTAYKNRKKSTALHKFIPWWIYLAAILATHYFFKYEIRAFIFHNANDPSVNMFMNNVIHTDLFLKITYALEVLLGLLALSSFTHSYSKKQFLKRRRSIEDLKKMPWQEFELLVAAVYRKLGYKVTETGLGGADGGIDLLMFDGQRKIIVQCKRWGATSIGAPIVREMFGLMTHHEADEVKIVCVGKFTKEAISFAEEKPIDLVSGDAFLDLLKSA